MADRTFRWESLDHMGLLVADVPWARLLPALRETSGETYVVRGTLADWLGWLQEPSESWQQEHLVGGDLDERSYVLSDEGGPASTADLIPLLAAHTGGTVLGFSYEDTTASVQVVAARGSELLRFVLDTDWGTHVEGDPLPGETDERSVGSITGFDAVLHALGVDADAWLDRGHKWAVLNTILDRDTQPAAHQRLYFGPLRRRVDAIHQAALDEAMGHDP
jgi:hypothetical protein